MSFGVTASWLDKIKRHHYPNGFHKQSYPAYNIR